MAYKRPIHLDKYESVSFFCGPLLHKENKEPKMCDRCKKDRAMWVHLLKKNKKQHYLCFGCGDH